MEVTVPRMAWGCITVACAMGTFIVGPALGGAGGVAGAVGRLGFLPRLYADLDFVSVVFNCFLIFDDCNSVCVPMCRLRLDCTTQSVVATTQHCQRTM